MRMGKMGIWIGMVALWAVPSMAENPFAGKWDVSMEIQGNPMEAVMEIHEGADGTLSGTWTSRRGTGELKAIKVEGETLSFDRDISMQGQDFTLTYQAKREGGKMSGQILTPQGDLPFTAVKAAGEATFIGDWTIASEGRGGQTMQSTLSLKEDASGKLSGTWTTQRGERALENVEIADGVLSFAQVFEREGQSFSMEYSAKLVDGKLEGTISTPRGERPFSGTRVGEAAEEGSEAERMVKALDANGDGFVDESEAPEQMLQFFGMIDANGDGKIDAAEMQTVVDFRRQNQQ